MLKVDKSNGHSIHSAFPDQFNLLNTDTPDAVKAPSEETSMMENLNQWGNHGCYLICQLEPTAFIAAFKKIPNKLIGMMKTLKAA